MRVDTESSFEDWLERQYRYCAPAMLRSISAVDRVKTRPGFGQTVRPVKGSIVASPVLGAYDPDPDYFFHWFRDSAVIIDALRLLHDDRSVDGVALTHFRDFVRFSLGLQELDGRAIVATTHRRDNIAPDFLKFLRDDEELATVRGAGVVAESRVNPDGTLDISKWARPQHDGPPLRALALLRWVRGYALDQELDADTAALIRADLDFTCQHWRMPSFDIWEEDNGHHYYTLRVSAAALADGAEWVAAAGDTEAALHFRENASAILKTLDGYWLDEAGYYRSRLVEGGAAGPDKSLDIAVILSAIHVGDTGAEHTVHDPRMQATLAKLDAVFHARYSINHDRPPGRGPALGRYGADRYYGGGAWYVSTLAAAEFCFRAAAGATNAAAWIDRGHAYLATVRAFTPADGALSEQFDPTSGQQLSAKHLAWSYAAFVSCFAARRAAVGTA